MNSAATELENVFYLTQSKDNLSSVIICSLRNDLKHSITHGAEVLL